MQGYNGYNGNYKGYQDEYDIITMSPWIEDAMQKILEIGDTDEMRENLINAAYRQREDINSVKACLEKELTKSDISSNCYKILEEALQKEKVFLVNK